MRMPPAARITVTIMGVWVSGGKVRIKPCKDFAMVSGFGSDQKTVQWCKLAWLSVADAINEMVGFILPMGKPPKVINWIPAR